MAVALHGAADHGAVEESRAAAPAGKVIHAILDNDAAHKRPKARQWFERHPRWVFHVTPTSSSWIHAVEGFFAKLSRRRFERGVSDPSSTCRPPSTASSPSTTTHLSPSSGGPIRTPSSQPESAGSKRWANPLAASSAAHSTTGLDGRQGAFGHWLAPERLDEALSSGIVVDHDIGS